MTPIPQSGPCMKRIGGEIVDAPYCVIGLDPDRRGGGVLYWAWSVSDASHAADAFRENGFHDVKVRNALTDKTKQEVHGIVTDLFGDEL